MKRGATGALLISIAVVLAWRYARAKNIAEHQRWATHAFLLVNGVWAFRLYLMGWYLVNQGPWGNTEQLDGPADIGLSFVCYLLPMAVAELYFWAKKQHNLFVTWGVAAVVSLGAIITLIGVGAAISFMWYPRVEQIFSAL